MNFYNDGRDTSDLEIGSDYVLVETADYSPYLAFYASDHTTAGSQSVTVPAGHLSASGLNLFVSTSNGNISSVVYSCTNAAAAAPVAAAVAATVAANSSANTIALNITGGAVTSVALGSSPSHGTASTSGTSITYTPTAGYSGTDSFTYTAANTSGTSEAATVTITVAAPTFVFSPATGTLPAGTVATAYSQSVSASGGTAPYTYSVSSGVLPAGLALNSSTGVISGTPTAAGNAVFTITATDDNSATGAAIYSVTTGAQATVANNVLTTVAANSSDNAITLDITGGAATSVAIATRPSHGAASASGTSITYTPTAGYSGSDSFTYTATNTVGTSSPASVAITVTAPALTFSPTTGALPAGTIGTAYVESATTTGGTAPYTYTVTSGALPAGLIINASTGTITGTPTTGGSYGFTLTATDANQISGSVNYTLMVTAMPVTLTISPASGALPTAKEGTAYSQSITTTTGTSPYNYTVTGMPAGLSIDTSTGRITGTPTAPGNYSIVVSVTDSASPANTGSASYTLAVDAAAPFAFSPASGSLKDAMVGEDYSQSISANGGTGTLTYSLASGALPKGMSLNVATGELTGPLADDAEAKAYSFTIQARDRNGKTGTATYDLVVKARSVTVIDKAVSVAAGSTPNNVNLTSGATGGPFTSAEIVSVSPANSGTVAIVRGEFAQASTPTALGWYLKFIPNPAYSGKVSVDFRLGSALGTSNTGAVTYSINYDASEVATDIDNRVHSFVQSRQNMISSTIKVPGLMERRQMGQATDPVSAHMMPSENGITVNFSTSLAQMESARDSADGVGGEYSSPLNIWIDGAFLAHNDKDINGGKWGSFAMLNFGADYLLSQKALVGLSFHYDYMTDPTDADAELKGNGWLAGPCASFEIGKGVFWNASLLYGGSSNTINTQFWDGQFDTKRWMTDTSLDGQWDLDDDTTVIPKLRAVYFSEKIEDYAVQNSAGDTIAIDGFNEDQFRVSLGAEIARSFTLESGTKLTPKLGLTGGYSGLDGSGAFGQITAGLALQTSKLWMLNASLLLNLEGGGEKSLGAKVSASRKF